jgi:hypothetical protein
VVYAPDSRIVIVADVQVAGGVESDSNRVIQSRQVCRDVISVITLKTVASYRRDNLSRAVDFQDLVILAVRNVNVPEAIDGDIGWVT